MTVLRINQTSELAVEAEVLLASLSMASVNAELGPLVRMTAPARWVRVPITEWPEGTHLFTSWILLFGFLPIDRHRFGLARQLPGEGFSETSTSLVNRRWNHERRIIPVPGGCRVTDHLEIECRLPLLGALLGPVYRYVFTARHRYLQKTYPSAH